MTSGPKDTNIEDIVAAARAEVPGAVDHFWLTRAAQAERQETGENADQGLRRAVTGGRQMDGFVTLITRLLIRAGLDEADVYCNQCLELPGYFRPTKMWDMLVVRNHQLLIAIEAKSQVGPSFGNNFNNRTEEAIGSALDLWTAFREGALDSTVRPWLGYLFLLEDCPRSCKPVSAKEPHFEVFPEFKKASYAERYELLCRKLLRERLYTASTLILSAEAGGSSAAYREPATDLGFDLFARSLLAHVLAFGGSA